MLIYSKGEILRDTHVLEHSYFKCCQERADKTPKIASIQGSSSLPSPILLNTCLINSTPFSACFKLYNGNIFFL